MGLDLTPRDYLEMLTDEYREYQDNRLSMRKAINCCGLANALPEIITAYKTPTDGPDAHKRKAVEYRQWRRERCEAHHTVRDFCDYSKHVKLGRKSVSVKEVQRIKQTKGSPMGCCYRSRTLRTLNCLCSGTKMVARNIWTKFWNG
jgi:hypothetical protein